MTQPCFTLTQAQARRFVLLWQGLAGPKRFAGPSGLLDFVRQAGCVQYDPVDLCGKNAEIVLFSRVARFQKPLLHQALYRHRQLVDHWDKNMALCPVEDWPCLARNRSRFRGWSYTEDSQRAVAEALPEIRRLVAERQVICAQDVALDNKIDWPWAPARLGRAALEYLYFTGELCVHHRQGAQRYYAASPALLPQALLDAPEPFADTAAYHAWHVRRRVAAAGLLWNKRSDALLAIPDLDAAARQAAFATLLAQGQLLACQVEGFTCPLYAVAEALPWLQQTLATGAAPLPPRVEFLAPLDSLLWDRALLAQLFGFVYRWEIYTPQAQRRYGAYVLPVLYQSRLCGRIEVVARRQQECLAVVHFWPEENFRPTKAFRRRLASHLARFARFNGCRQVAWQPGAGEALWGAPK